MERGESNIRLTRFGGQASSPVKHMLCCVFEIMLYLEFPLISPGYTNKSYNG